MSARRLDIVERVFDKIGQVGYNIMLKEVGDCYGASGGVELRLMLRLSRLGVWQIELTDQLNSGRIISSTFDDELQAREEVELAYRYGRQTGRWKIQRANGYVPAGTASPVGMEPHRQPDRV